MARQRKIIPAKDYDLLIKESEEKIEKLTNALKEEKANFKVLKKTKELYELQKAREEEQAKMNKIAELIVSSGKTMEEIEEYFSSTKQ